MAIRFESFVAPAGAGGCNSHAWPRTMIEVTKLRYGSTLSAIYLLSLKTVCQLLNRPVQDLQYCQPHGPGLMTHGRFSSWVDDHATVRLKWNATKYSKR